MGEHLKQRLHPQLRRKLNINRYVGTPVMLLLAAGFFGPAVSTWISGKEHPAVTAGLAAVGILFTWASWYIWSSVKWYERVSWVYYAGDTFTGSASYTMTHRGAVIAKATVEDGTVFEMIFTPPGWEVDTKNPETVIVHADPVQGGPVVLETSKGVIWPLERARSRTTAPERNPLR